VRKSLFSRIAIFLAVVGPGIITGNVDNDAGGITTYSIAGAHYGYSMLWVLLLVTIALVVVQEMSARLGAVTGKGLADLIRERYGVRTAVFTILLLVLANLATTISEFAGVAAASEILGISRYIAVPAVALFVWVLVLRGSFKVVERTMLALVLLFGTYIVSGIMARPDWSQVWRGLTVPTVSSDPGYIALVIALIGTTITPWMQFYQQALVVDKGLGQADLPYVRADTYLGAVMTDVMSFFMIVACGATLFPNGVRIESAAEAALALRPFAGRYATVLFAVGLLNASTMAASVLPLSTAHAVAEAFGFESNIGTGFRDAPVFWGLYTFFLAVGTSILIFPRANLVKVMLFSQTVNGILLPVILIAMLRLVNDKRIMGRHTNGRVANVIAWAQTIALIALTGILVYQTLFQRTI